VPEGSPQVFRPPASATHGNPPERLGYNFDGCAPETLVAHFEKMADHLASKGVEKQMILEQAIVTPSCGTGSMEVADAEKVFQTLPLVSQALRARHRS